MIETVQGLSIDAGKILMQHFERTHTITYKDPKDIVTEADIASETFLKQALKEAFPDFGFVGEETGESGSELAGRFIVDPLDGTVNFSRNIPLFAVSIGIEQEGQIAGGVIHAPALHDTWRAFQNEGAFHNDEKITVSKTNELDHSAVYTNDMNVGKERKESLNQKKYEWMKNVGSRVQRYRSIGTAAIELAWVAQGSLDGYFGEPLYYWDWAAGSALIQEAGGQFTQTNGQAVNAKSVSILGTNRQLHETILSLLQD